MFRPKHTIEAVAKELIDGLDEGTVLLSYDGDEQIDVAALQKDLWVTINARARRSQRLIAISVTVGLVAFLGGVVALLLTEQQTLQAYHVGVGGLVFLLAGFLFGFAFSTYRLMRTREGIADLRAMGQLLKDMDPESAIRVAPGVARRLRKEKEFSH